MYFFIVNLTSRTGKARAIWIQVERELRKREVEYEAFFTEREGHAKELADALCSRGVRILEEAGGSQKQAGGGSQQAGDRSQEAGGSQKQAGGGRQEPRVCLVVVGGDGTVNEVINGMHHFDQICFGYIATGSGNDLGRGLGIPKDPIEALQGILEAEEQFAMDLGRVMDGEGRERYFAISSGIGIDADVCKMALTSRLKKILNHLGLGGLTYKLLTVKALCSMPTVELAISFDGGSPRKIRKMIFVAGMNHPWEGGGVPMAPRASCQDGKLSVCCVHGIPRWKAFFLLPLLVKAKHEGLRGFEIVECERYELALRQPMALHGDGEYLGEQARIRYQCMKGMLRVLKV